DDRRPVRERIPRHQHATHLLRQRRRLRLQRLDLRPGELHQLRVIARPLDLARLGELRLHAQVPLAGRRDRRQLGVLLRHRPELLRIREHRRVREPLLQLREPPDDFLYALVYCDHLTHTSTAKEPGAGPGSLFNLTSRPSRPTSFGTVPRGPLCRPASAGPCRTGDTPSRSPRAAPPPCSSSGTCCHTRSARWPLCTRDGCPASSPYASPKKERPLRTRAFANLGNIAILRFGINPKRDPHTAPPRRHPTHPPRSERTHSFGPVRDS